MKKIFTLVLALSMVMVVNAQMTTAPTAISTVAGITKPADVTPVTPTDELLILKEKEFNLVRYHKANR